MKLKEWGYTRNNARTSRRGRSGPQPGNMRENQPESDNESDNGSEVSIEAVEKIQESRPAEV